VQLMESLGRLMKECWHAKPTARLTMLRVKKSLSKLLKSTVTAVSDDKLAQLWPRSQRHLSCDLAASVISAVTSQPASSQSFTACSVAAAAAMWWWRCWWLVELNSIGTKLSWNSFSSDQNSVRVEYCWPKSYLNCNQDSNPDYISWEWTVTEFVVLLVVTSWSQRAMHGVASSTRPVHHFLWSASLLWVAVSEPYKKALTLFSARQAVSAALIWDVSVGRPDAACCHHNPS